MLDGFEQTRIATSGAEINLRKAGQGPPLLMLHGYPQTQVMWHRIAPALAKRFTVVLTDLRGYGDSAKPPGGDHHEAYSKRAMAQDQVEVMAALGFEKFAVVGHDRGARVGHRLALDHPERVTKLAVLDVVPTYEIFAGVDRDLAQAYFHWFLMLQPEPLAERLIGADPPYFLRWILEHWCRTPGAMTKPAYAEYERCFGDPRTIHATCEDYRAVEVDLTHDAADLKCKIGCPLLVLWGGRGTTHPGWPSLRFDMLAVWNARAADVRGKPLDCGHFLAEEAPAETLAELVRFL